ncbi:MAG: pyruvate, phosphate dikinase [Candidatus Woesearchaeota archaeon]
MKEYAYLFEEAEFGKEILGGKGFGLAEMARLGIPVPPGFIITTDACKEYFEQRKEFLDKLWIQVLEKLEQLEKKVGKKLGSKENPLLVSVRSGAPVSMPGMMDTILNLGLNEDTVKALAQKTKNERFAYDAYRRFIQMFGNVVLGIKHDYFEKALEEIKEKKKAKFDYELNAESLKELIIKYKRIINEQTNVFFPEDAEKQLRMAVEAVFNSWNNERAKTYRKLNKIPEDMGTAVVVQAMVFGNFSFDSGTGVCFTRSPSTGEKKIYGEYLLNAQGEDVVAGIRTPKPIDELKKELPETYEQLIKVCEKLEKHFKDMQDIEFTIENKKLYLLQTRNGKRTAEAAVKIAVDMCEEGLITKEEAILRVEPEHIEKLMHKRINPDAKLKVIAKGLPASPGAAVGKVVFDANKAEELSKKGEKVVLVRKETSPDNIHGMAAAQGILTARGGMTSHAAVVARGMGKCCVAGCEEIKVVEEKGYFEVGDLRIKEGDVISLNGSTGEVILGEAPLIEPELSGNFKKILEWADSIRKLGVRANADLPRDAKTARDFGAEGIGLCRTEHMFFDDGRITIMQEMIMAENTFERKKALDKLLPLQRQDFKEIFEVMHGLPVIIRLLDPPLHEFLPKREEFMVEIALLKERKADKKIIEEKEKILKRVEELFEFNPMLGHRGCRLGITYPEITEMQARAIFEAACEAKKKGINVIPEVMVPLVGDVSEFKHQKEIIDRVAEETFDKYNLRIDYKVGTMIELPRAAITADKIAEQAEFFSFGTNDLTQTTLGFSRDDAGKFVKVYLELGILKEDPFKTIDVEGVGSLVERATKLGKQRRPNLEVGICGEHGGDPKSVEFCHKAGLDYVSCSPYRVPIARLAAAQAAIKEKMKKNK